MATTLSQAVVIALLGGLTLYAFIAKETVYVPINGSPSYSLSQLRFTPSYLQQVASNVMQLRLTWSNDTVVDQYGKLMSMVQPKERKPIREQFNREITAIKKRHMSSVFYQDQVATKLDIKSQEAQVTGMLQRVDAGVVLQPVKRTYLLKFNYSSGTLQVVSIKEVKSNA
ncbi:TraE/TraK family type IV conjugative transfer system protein [Piscirickettsia salmonis]|nr:TraE/TraK family type IV conjugative transfer system protein [Piscirickettsia salmonis]AMA44090.1 hypothetical protein AWJ11_17080 [Piscirickettsia salmonis]AOS36863.1 hypothetical protein AVM72_15925 [Piscirickettsia salmonis]APS68781.1 hypothetical protein AVI55_17075 [Piscirickettsia salmonis]APS72016.1 hypothetical protein AVI56_16970 [Piscirickettsia salmonis]APS81575.1 hypothetical protein AVM73_15915 [Piscirickettsia salmonis]